MLRAHKMVADTDPETVQLSMDLWDRLIFVVAGKGGGGRADQGAFVG